MNDHEKIAKEIKDKYLFGTVETQQMQLYTLYDDNNSDKVHLIDFTGVTDPVGTIGHLNQNYSVLSTFYVIVVRAGTDYSSAVDLIKELQTSPPSLTTTLSSETD